MPSTVRCTLAITSKLEGMYLVHCNLYSIHYKTLWFRDRNLAIRKRMRIRKRNSVGGQTRSVDTVRPQLLDNLEEDEALGSHRIGERNEPNATNDKNAAKFTVQGIGGETGLSSQVSPGNGGYTVPRRRRSGPVKRSNKAFERLLKGIWDGSASSSQVASENRSTGARRRKSGSVKKFAQDLSLNGREGHEIKNPNSVSSELVCRQNDMYEISRIIRPIGYSTCDLHKGQDDLLMFEAIRSDGKEVMVDNKYLRSHHPLLLIDYYEKNIVCTGREG